MSGDRELFEVLEDLEAQAESEHHRGRADELHDRARSAYHEVPLESRLMATLGAHVELTVEGMGQIAGALDRVGSQWCRVRQGQRCWIVLGHALMSARGVSSRAVPRVAWSPVDTMGVGSPLRRVADEGRPCVVHLLDGQVVEGEVERVGADFIELLLPRTERMLIPLRALAAVGVEG